MRVIIIRFNVVGTQTGRYVFKETDGDPLIVANELRQENEQILEVSVGKEIVYILPAYQSYKRTKKAIVVIGAIIGMILIFPMANRMGGGGLIALFFAAGIGGVIPAGLYEKFYGFGSYE